jgi:hypothetical protein
MFKKLFGDKDKITLDVSGVSLPILFHKEANGQPEHGVLEAEHVQLKVRKHDGVRFCFDGMDNPPKMTAALMAYITDQAERKGFIVHSLHSYATVVTLQPAPRLDYVDSKSQAPEGRAPRTGISRGLRRPSGERAAQGTAAAHA